MFMVYINVYIHRSIYIVLVIFSFIGVVLHVTLKLFNKNIQQAVEISYFEKFSRVKTYLSSITRAGKQVAFSMNT